MTKTTAKQKREINHGARPHGAPDVEADLGASGATAGRQRRKSDESERPRDRGLVVSLWLLALLIAEVELWIWVFAHMYGR